MRCLYALGAVRAMVYAGLHDGVRSIHCVSSGAIPAAMLHLACGGHEIGGFIDELTSRHGPIVRPWRPGRVIDLERLVAVVDELLQPTLGSPEASDVALEVGLTEALTGRARYLDLTGLTMERRRAALRATMAFPLLHSNRVTIDGVAYLDGGIADPLPVQRAIAAGADHIIAITNKGAGRCGKPSVGLAAWLVRAAPNVHDEVKRKMLTRNPLRSGRVISVMGRSAGWPIVSSFEH